MRSALKFKCSSPGCGVTPSNLVDGALVSPQPFASMIRVVETLTVPYPTASSLKRRFKRLSLGKKRSDVRSKEFLSFKTRGTLYRPTRRNMLEDWQYR